MALAADVRPLVRLSVSVLVEHDGKRERGASGGGGRYGYEYFLKFTKGKWLLNNMHAKRCVWRW